ncbi:MAG: glycosyltransferase [Chloroflexota bacterium]
MNILILTIGSRGDIQPFVALGKGLKAAGHDVTVCTAQTFEAFVSENGLRYATMTDELIRLGQTSQGKAVMDSGGKGFGLIQKVKPILRTMFDQAWDAASAAPLDALIYHPKTLAGYHIAEKLKIPVFMSMPLPAYTPTRAFANPIFGINLRLGGTLNRWSFAITRAASAPYLDVINDWRLAHGLSPRSRFASEIVLPDGRAMPTLYCYSPQVIPTPADWLGTTVATGYWFLDQPSNWQPSSALVDFLNAGEPPVYVGFGSMAGSDPQAKARLVLDALRQTGQRGLLASGWGGLKADALPKDVFMIDQAPHDWLFPRMKAVVHHGGAGTTAAGLRAGKPMIICPFFGDQPFWGQRIYELGLGAQPIPQKKLTAETLASALQTVVADRDMAQRAAALSEKICAEDGITRAVEIIERTTLQ